MVNLEGNNSSIARNCSNCGSSQVRRTRRKSTMDWFLSKMNFYPYYCQECDARSHRFGRK